MRDGIVKEWENPSQVREEMENYTYFQDDFYEIYEKRERNNWWTLINGLNLLVWNTSAQWSLGWVEQEQDVKTELEESPALREFYELSGLTEKQFAELVANGYDYDAQGFIGEIVDAGDLVQEMLSLSITCTVARERRSLHSTTGWSGMDTTYRPECESWSGSVKKDGGRFRVLFTRGCLRDERMDVAMMGSENTPFALSFVKDANTIESESVTSMDVLISIDTTLKIMLSYIEGEIPLFSGNMRLLSLISYRTLDSSVIFTMPWIG